MLKHKDLLKKFIEVKQEVKNLVDKFPESSREEILFDKWSLKDVLAHLNHWMENDLGALENLVNGKKSYWYPDVEQFNTDGVSKRKERSWEEVYNEFVTLMKELESKYDNLDSSLFEADLWQNHKGTPYDSVNIDIGHWEKEHIPSLKEVLKRIRE